MSAREEVLTRVRAAGGGGPAAPGDIARSYRPTGDHPPGDPHLIDLLTDRILDYKGHMHRATDDGVADTVAEIFGLRSGQDSAVPGSAAPVVVPPGLPGHWLPPTVDVVWDDGGLDISRLEAMAGVVTAAAVAIAETGTIVLDGSAGQGRRILTLLPDLHVCVIRPGQIVATVPEALARLAPARPLTWISGPSATSDIELDRVEGVHGPRRLHVVICESQSAAAGA